MARPSTVLINALRQTAKNLRNGSGYQWGHMGACNCGNLAQVLTPYSKGEIHEFAMQKSGDWSEQLTDYCPTSGFPMDLLISGLIEQGLTPADLRNLEWLSDHSIIRKVGRHLKRNNKTDVIDYLESWADLLEDKMVDQVDLSELLIADPKVERVTSAPSEAPPVDAI